MNPPRFVRDWLLWQLVGFAFLLAWPPYFWFGGPIWEIATSERAQIFSHASGFLVAAVVLSLMRLGAGSLRVRTVVHVVWLSMASLVVAFLIVSDSGFDPSALVGCFLIAAAFAIAPLAIGRLALARTRTGILGLVLLLSAALTAIPGTAPKESVARGRTIQTVLHTIEGTFYRNLIPRPQAEGGGIDRDEDGYLLATGEGVFYRFDWDEPPPALPHIERLPLGSPSNREAFDRDAPSGADRSQFRLIDLLITGSGSPALLVSHHFWDEDEACVRLRISSLDLATPLDGYAADAPWSTLFETEPCLRIGTRDGLVGFRGDMMGGRLAEIDAQRVMLTVGDGGQGRIGNEMTGHLGTTIIVDRSSGSARTFTRGHRNPEGLLVDTDGTIWLTEHGPRGGDELNLLVDGRHYGWPYVSLGVDYGSYLWSMLPLPPGLEVTNPAYAWFPSIGVSNLVRLEGETFPRWKNDLLVSSLTGGSLYRIRLDGNEVAYGEPIEIGPRIRDVFEGPDRILLWTDQGTLVSLGPSEDRGAQLFSECLACHTSGSTGTSQIGPDLAGVYGRPIASLAGYDYSDALRAWEGRWTAETLGAYLKDPDEIVPGTTMEFRGLPDAVERQELVTYLEGLK